MPPALQHGPMPSPGNGPARVNPLEVPPSISKYRPPHTSYRPAKGSLVPIWCSNIRIGSSGTRPALVVLQRERGTGLLGGSRGTGGTEVNAIVRRPQKTAVTYTGAVESAAQRPATKAGSAQGQSPGRV